MIQTLRIRKDLTWRKVDITGFELQKIRRLREIEESDTEETESGKVNDNKTYNNKEDEGDKGERVNSGI